VLDIILKLRFKMELKKEYEKIKEKYNLPSYDEINNEFEISAIDIEKVNSLTRAVLRVICNRMGIYLNYIEPVISPNPQGLHAFVEVENTTNDEKKDLFTFYKVLSHRYHKAYSLELVENEETIAKEIKEILKDWSKIKSEFKKLSSIITKSWERERQKEKVDTIG
tara:strand:+ start:2836 stop:3333 length:498 start_codon:yes stop_codon:yes gene_type:complete